jgi:hypothetical protein
VILALGFSSLLILTTSGLFNVLKRERVVWFGAAWLVLTLFPILPIYAERQLYLPSIGAAISIGGIFAACLRHGDLHRQRYTCISLVILLAANLASLAERSYWWKTSGEISRETTQIVLDTIPSAKPGTKLVLLNVPDNLRLTHVQGPHFPDTIQLSSGNSWPTQSVVIGSFLWAAPENVNRSLPSNLLNDPAALVIDIRAGLEARGFATQFTR